MIRLLKVVVGGFAAFGAAYTLVCMVGLFHDNNPTRATADGAASLAAAALYAIVAIWLLTSAFRKPADTRGANKKSDTTQVGD